jgi:curved DNA-binding protein CbpA
MSFEFTRGLFKLDFTDHHAILGMPIDATAKEIRKRFMTIARHLHPDVCKSENKLKAEEVLSKLVNPAYAKLSNDRERDEYLVLLKMMGKRLVQEHQSISPQSDAAKKLFQTAAFEPTYKTLLNELAQKQYENLDTTLDAIAEISELNLVYLLRKERDGGGVKKDSRPAAAVPLSTAPPATTGAATASQPPQSGFQTNFVEQHYRRAEALAQKADANSLLMARKELQEAIKLDPSNSRIYALMGIVFLRQNRINPNSVNVTMAKQHVTQALRLNAQEPLALEARKLLNQLAANEATGGKPTTAAKAAQPKTSQPKTAPPKPDNKSSGGGGLFGGLFGGGGKKK